MGGGLNVLTLHRWRALHRWLALLISLPLIIVVVTGILLLFRAPLERSLHPELVIAPGTVLNLNHAQDTIEDRYPERRVQALALPNAEHDTLIVNFSGKPGSPRLQVLLDPGSGKVLAERDPGTTLSGIALDLHRRLALGAPGDWVMGISGILLTVTLLSGLWLWLRGGRVFKFSFGKTTASRLFGLHRLLGVLTLPLCVLIAVTGVFLSFPTWRTMLGAPPRTAAPANPPVQAGGISEEPANWSALYRSAGPHTEVLLFPRRGGEGVRARQSDGSSIWLDPVTAEVQRRQDRALHEWLLPLHSGEFLSVAWPTRTLYTLNALGLLALLVTGVWWWRVRVGKRQPLTAPAPAAASQGDGTLSVNGA
jgi:uncharacterized iron-regulated membrane protein